MEKPSAEKTQSSGPVQPTPEKDKINKEIQLTAELEVAGFKKEYVPDLVKTLSDYESVVVLSPQSTSIEDAAEQAAQMKADKPDSKVVFNFEGEVYILGVQDYAFSKKNLIDRYLSIKATRENRQRTFTELFGEVDVDGITEVNILDHGHHLPEDKRPEILRNIENKIQERFPNTYDISEKITWGEFVSKLKASCKTEEERKSADEFILETGRHHKERADAFAKKEQYASRISVDIPIEERPFSEFRRDYFQQKKRRAIELYRIASFLKGKALDGNVLEEDLEKELQGKKILVLGDDSGSFSEILNSFGAEAFGIEYNKIKVLAAHSGVFAESGLPQDQVIQGDIGDLTDQSSSLYKTLLEKGPFDVITSSAVFNIGSGIENAIKTRGIGKDIDDQSKDFGRALTDGSMNLLSAMAFCLHDDVDMHTMFGKYSDQRDMIRFVGSMRIANLKKFNHVFHCGDVGTGHNSSLVFIPKSRFNGLA